MREHYRCAIFYFLLIMFVCMNMSSSTSISQPSDNAKLLRRRLDDVDGQSDEPENNENPAPETAESPNNNDAEVATEDTAEKKSQSEEVSQVGEGEEVDNSASKSCEGGDSCTKCKSLADGLLADENEDYTCHWTANVAGSMNETVSGSEVCRSILKATASADGFICSADPVASKTGLEAPAESNAGLFIFLVMAVVAGVSYSQSEKLREMLRHIPAISYEYEMQAMNGNNDRAFQTESVPLSVAKEEWGWEEGGFEDSNSDRKEDDDLQMALAMSLSNGDSTAASTNDAKQSPPVTTRKPPLKQTLGASSNRPSSGNTKLFTPSSNGNKAPKTKPVPVKDKEVDDIFASMGLSAKPTFQRKPATTQPTTTQASTTQQQKKPVNFYAADEESSQGSNWDDDDDLDDLLGD